VAQWKVAAGPASIDLAKRLARHLGAEWVEAEWRTFPDGESLVRVTGDLGGKRVLLVQSTYPPVDTHYMQAFLLAHKLAEMGAEVFGVLPYLGYSRQDQEFRPGEVISIGVVARLLRYSGFRRILTVDITSARALAHFPIPIDSVSAIPLLAKRLKESLPAEEIVAVAPDAGASARVEAFAKILGCEYYVLEKFRDRATGEVTVAEAEIPVRGKTVVFVDDIISTGETLCRAARLVRRQGAKSMKAACVHPILVDNALPKLREAGIDTVIATNTVPSPVSSVDVTPILAAYFEG
jgi:ribose-phosphate pyrophosphokinase